VKLGAWGRRREATATAIRAKKRRASRGEMRFIAGLRCMKRRLGGKGWEDLTRAWGRA
jgi:hypothetical protein